VILVLTNADTEILALRSVVEGLPAGFPPVRAGRPVEVPGLDGVSMVLVRLLGGRRAWEEQFDDLRRRCVDAGIPLLAFGGEATPDAELTALSTAAPATVARAFEYLAHGGLRNTDQLLRFVAGFPHQPPEEVPSFGVLGERRRDPARPTVGVVFYRAHVLAGNTQFVDDLCDAIESRGANALPVWCYSLRADAGVFDVLGGVDALVATVLAMGVSDGDDWDASALAALDVPVLQAVCATQPAEAWQASAAGLTPIDVAMSVAIPEFDGRIIGVPFSFKEVVDGGDELGAPVTAYRTVPDRVDRIAGLATRLAALRHVPNDDKRLAVVLSAYPTKKSRIGNAVGLDTPASVVGLLHRLRDAGYRVDRIPEDGDALMTELADGGICGRWPAERYTAPASVTETWGQAEDEFAFAGIDLGGVLVAIQPARGFGENPIAVYHSPDLAPTHHYVAFYRWLEEAWGAHAVVHVGKHGTLEWLPGKGVGLSATCGPDAALGDLPLVYPFVVNDPGEGTQAKRRAHAVIIDHLLPPMTRADSYDDVARLEALLDEHASIAALDPAKLPAIRARVWELLVQAEIHRDLGVTDRPEGDDFDDLVLHVDGYLCELKDAQIRGGLHILGRPPEGEAELDLVLAITRLPQGDNVPALRAATDGTRNDVDAAEAEARATLAGIQSDGWSYAGEHSTLRWVCDRLIPALHRTTDEFTNLLGALDGRHVSAGPSGAPTRGMAHVLPTGRNFFSVDPKAIPSRLAWDVGRKLADQLIERHVKEEGRPPATVGLVVWGTAAMRTGGDDVAEALALLGVRPVWAEESGRVTGIELIRDAELGRARVDVTLRISGFFRDAFPHVIALLDDAVRLAGFDDDPRIFGSKPGAYGSGILALLESREWDDDADLAAVYTAWGGYSYGRAAMGAPAADAMQRRFSLIEVAVKNQDNREHDIFDSDDYLQDHGGMIATIRSLRAGEEPKAWFGDSANPAAPKVRSLAEEAARVVRTRVLNPKWIGAMCRHGYKGAFEMAATVDYLFGYDATAHVVEDWMYERVTEAYVGDPAVRKLFEQSNPWALRSIAERLLEAKDRGLWDASPEAMSTLRSAVLEAEGWEESR
jgi:cobaltochelatase CobN